MTCGSGMHCSSANSCLVTTSLYCVQGIIFLLAGFETVANTLGLLVYHLAKNPEAMELLEREVEDTLAAFDGRVDHETIADMRYLDGCVRETLRSSHKC
jgi:cytochrome P450 family 6